MKTKFPFLVLGTLLILATAWTSPAIQNGTTSNRDAVMDNAKPGDFAFFRTHRQGKGVAATWGLNAEAGTIGFRVEKTYEDPSDPYAVWEDVENIGCNGSRSYKCVDKSVFPGNISYRVVAQKADGSTVASPVSTVRIVSH